MSWWVYLETASGETVNTDCVRREGGTHAMCGTTEAELNVTYNYGRFFDFKKLTGMTAKEAMPLLLNGINRLSGTAEDDPWKPTEGNAKAALEILYQFARYAVENKIEAKFRVS